MGDSSRPIRSYQRIFKPERRVYAIDGRRLPVPGGVPLGWLGWAFATLIVVLVLSQRQLAFAVVVAGIAGLLGAGSHGWSGAAIGAAGGFVATLMAGVALDWVDWPLRLLVAPGMLATLAVQPAPDGRPSHRYLTSLLALHLRPAHRSLAGTVDDEGGERVWAPRVWVAPDERSPVLHHGRVRGPARLVFARQVVAVPARGRMVLRPAEGHRMRRGERLAEVVELGDGQVVEIRP
jgi:hypothetical protein